MDEKEIQALLAGSTGSTNLTTSERSATLAQSRIGSMPRTPEGSGKGFIERNLQGLPIDTDTGAPAAIKFQVALRGTPESKLSYLQDVYGKGNARLSDTGEPLIKVLDDAGKPKELKVNEDAFTISDFASLAAEIPEFAGGVAAMVAASRVPGLKLARSPGTAVARDVVAQSVGAELGGLPKDVIYDNAPLTAAALDRAKSLPASVAAGGVMEVGARALRIGSPFAGAKGTIEQQQTAARQYFQERFGIDVPMTAGEQTGSSALKRIEATMGRLPGSSKEFKDLRAEKQDRMGRIQNRMLGLPEEATPAERLARMNEEGVGEEATTAIQANVQPQQQAVEAAAGTAQQAATAEVMDLTAKLTKTGRELHPEKVGAGIRTKALAEREAFQAESQKLYGEAYALPGGADRTLTPANLPKDAQKLIDELPSKTVITEEPTGVTGPGGKPITKSVEGREVLKEFIPPGVLGKLESLAGLEDQQFSLQDLVRMRTEVSNDIARGEAVPGVQTHFLNRIRDTITKSIEEATTALPDGQLKAAWQKANSYYRDTVTKFHEPTIARLFKDIESRGFVQNEDVVRNIGPTEYASYKKFLGESSPEFQALKRSIADTVIEAATPLSGGVIDGAALISQLKNMKDKNRTVFDDIFGPKTRNFQELSDVLRVGNAKVDEEKFKALIASGSPTGEAVRKLVQEQRKLDKVYQGKMVKEIAERTVGGEGFDPAEFVNRFYDKASIKDVRAVIDQLHDQPEVLEKVRKSVIEKIFHEGQRHASELDPSRLGRGEIFRPTNHSSLDKAFGDELRKEKLELILGRQTFQDFEQLSKLLRGSELTEAAFAGAGGLAAGMQVTNMMRNGLFAYATDYVKQKVYALAMTNPLVRKIITNQLVTPDRAAKLGKTLLVSKPFIEAVMDEFGDEGENVMQMLKSSADQSEGNATPEQRAKEILAAP